MKPTTDTVPPKKYPEPRDTSDRANFGYDSQSFDELPKLVFWTIFAAGIAAIIFCGIHRADRLQKSINHLQHTIDSIERVAP